MNKLIFIFCALLVACTDSGMDSKNQKESVVLEIESVSKKDNLERVEDSNLIFKEFYNSFTKAMSIKDVDQLNGCIHPQYGLYIIESPGALPMISKVYSLENFYLFGSKRNIYEKDILNIEMEPVFDSLPKVICAESIYDKTGCYAAEVNPLIDSQIWNYAGLNEKEIQAIEFLAETVNISVVNTSNFTFYFSKIEGIWQLTFVDLRAPCAA